MPKEYSLGQLKQMESNQKLYIRQLRKEIKELVTKRKGDLKKKTDKYKQMVSKLKDDMKKAKEHAKGEQDTLQKELAGHMETLGIIKNKYHTLKVENS